MALGKPLSTVKPWSDEKKWEDALEMLSFPDNKQILIRVVGNVVVLARHWVRTLSGKSFPAWCPQFDSQKEEYDTKRPCPAHDDFEEKSQKVIVGNCIVRSLQERGDDNPVRSFMLPHAILDDFTAIAEITKCDPADPEKGVDLAIKFSPKAQGNKKWGAQRGDTTPLTKAELKFTFPNLEEVIPNFTDPEVAQQYARTMKSSMARNKYYVVQEERVPEGARDPFKYFKGSEQGKPWHHFQELVDYRNEQAKDKAESTHKVKKDDDAEESIKDEPRSEFKRKTSEDEAPPPAKKEAKPEPEDEAPPPAKKEAAKDSDDEAPPAKKEAAKSGVHPDASIGTREHPKHGTVPECFEHYDGKQKCQRCSVRSKCIDLTDDNDV